MTSKQRTLDALSNHKLYEMLLNGELHEQLGYGVRYLAII